MIVAHDAICTIGTGPIGSMSSFIHQSTVCSCVKILRQILHIRLVAQNSSPNSTYSARGTKFFAKFYIFGSWHKDS